MLRWFRSSQLVKDQGGFTLIELLAVAVILIILSLMAMPIYAHSTDQSRYGASSADMRAIETALERHKADKGFYPDRLWTLVDAGYLKPSFTFESPWSSGGAHPVYFFYAIDRSGRPQAYFLGDPGPNTSTCNDDDDTRTFRQSTSEPFPCGRDPRSEARHWSGGATLSLLFDHPFNVSHLKDYRTPCNVLEKGMSIAERVQCTYKADS